ncbi:MAG: AAA family ATPase [Phycisphaerae bacterium]|jgi:predicted ATP-dependent endonuclease of OLD family
MSKIKKQNDKVKFKNIIEDKMKLSELRIENFRSFKDQTINFDDYTCLVGPNGSGKSAVLMALNVFFRNNDSTVTDVLNLTKEDFHHGNVQQPVKITLTFEDLPNEDDPLISTQAKELIKLYARQDKLVLFAKAEWDETIERAPVKQYGSRLVMKDFKSYFKAKEDDAKVAELSKIYNELREKFSELPKATTGTTMQDALHKYENERSAECSMEDAECQCYGFTGGLYRLADLVQWVYIPAVKDASSEQEEGSKTALGQLLQRTVRAKINFKSDIDELESQIENRYNEILEKEKGALKELGLSIQDSLREWTNPRANLELEWHGEPIRVKGPIAKAKVGEDAFIDQGISRMGHGMQRGFIVAILKELVATEQKGGSKLLLGFEEPELYQHPPQAQHMQSVLERLAEPGNNSQVIVTSHSPYFVSSKGFKNIRMFRKYGKKPCSVVKSANYEKVQKRITKAFGKEAQSPTSLMATVGQIMQTSQKEIFFSPVVVLVEGEEDVAFIATHLNLTGEWKSFRRNGCHFIVAGGKNNMPRLVAIAQEFDIPTFVICDSDIESCIERIEQAEKLPEGDSGRADKIKGAKEGLNKQKEINKAIASLCGLQIEDTGKCETIRGNNIIMWKDSIGTEVERSFEGMEWQEAQDVIVKEYGFEEVKTKKKNGMVIAATLEKLHEKKKQSPILIDLCGRISQYAQKAGNGGKI